jgi:hypothetical protein
VYGEIVSPLRLSQRRNHSFVGLENVECLSAYAEHMNAFYVRLNVRNSVIFSTACAEHMNIFYVKLNVINPVIFFTDCITSSAARSNRI